MKLGNRGTMKSVLAFAAALTMVMPGSAHADEHTETQQVRELLAELHVSGITEAALAGKSIEEMIKGLQDPYTAYFSSEQLSQFSDSIENSYVGIGVRIGLDADGVYIDEVFAGSPAEAAGLQAEDYIRSVDGAKLEPGSTSAAKSKIVGASGTKVKIEVQRGAQTLTFEVARQAVNIPEVYSKRFGNDVGYMQITDFSSDADEDFSRQLHDLKSEGLKALIVDVRNNPGGLLETAQQIARSFVKEGILIHTKDRNGVDEPVEIGGGSELEVPVFVLVNENSASASEVLSGALQDYGVAEVIGMKTYGKGSVQQVYELADGGALKVTIEEYLTPDMHKVNKVGISPDIEVDGEAAQTITALRRAGIADMEVRILKRHVTYNGVQVSDSLGLIRKNGTLYLPSRFLAALVDARISWNNASRTVDLQKAGETHSIPADTDKLIIENGTSYADVALFKAYYPQLSVAEQGTEIMIRAAKGN